MSVPETGLGGGLAGRGRGRKGRVTIKEGCVVAHGGCNWVGMRCLGMNVISLCECAYGVESIIWKELWSIMSYELKMVSI